ncbi:hereditary hemochromatosis protein-like isoform X2 [Sinocyclocheilus anshuiensis]|uniref:hereditary hemochromatosis protein-like isoform X2 n=1 Tax=Sinocyclocheilus anshuiensis TaxID=1608454 RepID=UPI0007B7F14A|nr:PREDICTED: hereditary hemochromatosis protein-like isoform X2 [Sinocyclocheilus anshuiensis]
MIYDLRHKDLFTQIMLFCVYLLTCFQVAKSDVHSLMAFVTYIAGQTPFPEFSAVLMLDDVQIGYYDSVTWKPVYRTNSTDLQFHEEEQKDADIVFRVMYNIFKERAFYLKEQQNHTDVKPRVRFMNKTLSDSQGLQISCLATGFYPRHINLTMFRDGQPVDDDQITGGEILPNGDGTCQMRKSLVISEEELCEEHKYNCTMKHLNLENKLDITYDVAECDPGSFSHSVVFSVLVFMCVAVLIITAVIIWRKRRAAGNFDITE